jgi:hypothetical protein
MAEGFAKMLESANDSVGAEPAVIADLIYEAVTATQPETRYAAGFMEKEIS